MCAQQKCGPSFWAPVTAPNGRDGEKLDCGLSGFGLMIVAVERTFLKGCGT